MAIPILIPLALHYQDTLFSLLILLENPIMLVHHASHGITYYQFSCCVTNVHDIAI